MTKKCVNCNGTYETTTNNSPYFHTCALIFNGPSKKYELSPNHRDENIITSSIMVLNPKTGRTEEKIIATNKNDGLGTIDI